MPYTQMQPGDMQPDDMQPGFGDPVFDSQAVFRALLHAMSRPGMVNTLDIDLAPPAPLSPAAAAVCLTLADLDTPVWVTPGTPGNALSYLRFHCGCPMVENPAHAAFALITDGDHLPDLTRFSLGTQEYPDRSATLIIQVSGLEAVRTGGVRLTGPGIESMNRLAVRGLSDDFWAAFAANHQQYPLGWDVVFATEDRIASLPRSTRTEI